VAHELVDVVPFGGGAAFVCVLFQIPLQAAFDVLRADRACKHQRQDAHETHTKTYTKTHAKTYMKT